MLYLLVALDGVFVFLCAFEGCRIVVVVVCGDFCGVGGVEEVVACRDGCGIVLGGCLVEHDEAVHGGVAWPLVMTVVGYLKRLGVVL